MPLLYTRRNNRRHSQQVLNNNNNKNNKKKTTKSRTNASAGNCIMPAAPHCTFDNGWCTLSVYVYYAAPTVGHSTCRPSHCCGHTTRHSKINRAPLKDFLVDVIIILYYNIYLLYCCSVRGYCYVIVAITYNYIIECRNNSIIILSFFFCFVALFVRHRCIII